MASLVRHITALSAAGYGVNILEEDPPPGLPRGRASVVAIVGDFPWGAINTVHSITGVEELYATLCPLPFAALNTYAAMKAFIGKTFPNTIKVVRIPATSQATAAHTFDDASAGDSVTVTAKYPGLLGNSVSVTWTVNADDAGHRDATVSIGTTYSVLYENVATDTGGVTVVDPGDPYVTFTEAAGATAVPVAIAATALSGGSDGVAVAGDYLGTTAEGLKLFEDENVAWDVLFMAEVPTALTDAVNAGLKTFADGQSRGTVELCTPHGQAKGTAQTYAASYRSDRIHYPYPRVKTVNTYDPNRGTITVDGNAFAAAAIANTDPWKSPGGANSAPWLKGIIGLEDGVSLTRTDYDNLNAAGVSPFFNSTAHSGFILHKGITTLLTSGRTTIVRRRATDRLLATLGGIMEKYTELPLDIDLSGRRLGPTCSNEATEIEGFLDEEWRLGRIATQDNAPAYSVDYYSGSSQANIDAGQWIILLSIKLTSAQFEIVLRSTVGETVQIDVAV